MLGEGQPKSFGAETAFELPYLATHEKRNLALSGTIVPGRLYPVIYPDDDIHSGVVVPPNVILLARRGRSGEAYSYQGYTDYLENGWEGELFLPKTDGVPDVDPAKWAAHREWLIQCRPHGSYSLRPRESVFKLTPHENLKELTDLHAQDRRPTRSPGVSVARQNVFSFN